MKPNTPILLLLIFLAIFIASCQKEPVPIINPCPPSYSSFTDMRNGRTYRTVTICNQTWMAENLFFYDGIGTAGWGYFNYDDPDTTYGFSYNFENALKVCPNGWHLPSDAEWQTLEIALGMSPADANSLGYRGAPVGDHLKSNLVWGVDRNNSFDSGFNAVAAGYFYFSGFGSEYEHVGEAAYFWTATTYNSENQYAYGRTLYKGKNTVFRNKRNKGVTASCRCVMD